MITLEQAMAAIPVVAIIRGVKPDEVLAIAEALHDAGVRMVEVPLNSPQPMESIRSLTANWGERLVCGAGTVLSVEACEQVAKAGGKILVSPDTRPEVIRRAIELGMTPMPGFATASEMFRAHDAGARNLKLFPASTYGSGHVKQLMAVCPTDTRILAVGGVGVANMAEWWAAGARGFGLGSELYRPGQSADETFEKARAVVLAVRALNGAAALKTPSTPSQATP